MKSLVAAGVVMAVFVVVATVIRVFALVLGDWFWPVWAAALVIAVTFLILNYISGRGAEE